MQTLSVVPTEPRKTKDLPDPQDGMEPKGAQKPKDPAKGDYEKGAQKPPDGDKSDPAHPEEPSWLVSLPEQIQRMITGSYVSDVVSCLGSLNVIAGELDR